MAATATTGVVAGIGHGHGVVREQGRRGGVRLGRWSSWAREVGFFFIFVFILFCLFSFLFSLNLNFILVLQNVKLVSILVSLNIPLRKTVWHLNLYVFII